MRELMPRSQDKAEVKEGIVGLLKMCFKVAKAAITFAEDPTNIFDAVESVYDTVDGVSR
jgi:hypothetical protein